MDKISTSRSLSTPSSPPAVSRLKPKQSTLAFLRQFARCYTFEPRVDPSIASLSVN